MDEWTEVHARSVSNNHGWSTRTRVPHPPHHHSLSTILKNDVSNEQGSIFLCLQVWRCAERRLIHRESCNSTIFQGIWFLLVCRTLENCRRKRTITATGSSADVRAPERLHRMSLQQWRATTLHLFAKSCNIRFTQQKTARSITSFGTPQCETPQQIRHDALHCIGLVKCSCGWLTSCDVVGVVVAHVSP